ncbi:MAG: hypothetical protein ACEQSX_18505, partial [Baekduiaceae bacterium]
MPRRFGEIPPPVVAAVRSVWDQAGRIAPRHRRRLKRIVDETLQDLQAKMQRLGRGRYTTVATASKIAQLKALAERLG